MESETPRIRCAVLSAWLLTDETCKARIAWAGLYDKRKRATLNNNVKHSERARWEAYQLCRVCKGLAVAAGVKKCTICGSNEHYARGICQKCYNRERARRINK